MRRAQTARAVDCLTSQKGTMAEDVLSTELTDFPPEGSGCLLADA